MILKNERVEEKIYNYILTVGVFVFLFPLLILFDSTSLKHETQAVCQNQLGLPQSL